ncbi:MAG TPA: multiheme c-type cytochrome, partial [Acidobacteriota bacterium]|nr:multiheme c-type cytochrome [Acidobacteriota bacterium]
MRPEIDDLFTVAQLREWRSRLTSVAFGLFLAEAFTGLVIYLAPFSVTAQVSVIVHSLVGVAFIAPYAWYQAHHWRVNWSRPFNQHKLLGYLSLLCVGVAAVSGLVLTAQAGWGRRIDYAWDLVHLVAGLAATAFVLWHVAIIVVRHATQSDGGKRALLRGAQLSFAKASSLVVLALLVPLAVWVLMTPQASVTRPFPADYQLPFGDNPFAPSLATTATNEAFHPETLSGSERCGTSDCHAEVLEEWQPSAHRYAAMSPFFQGVQGAMAVSNGAESTRYCAGCHDPISLFSGSKNLYTDDLSAPGYREGVSCVACHSIEQTDIRGNANYVIAAQPRYLYESSEAALAAFASDFLIRAYPHQHLSSWSRELYKSPEYCAACHKQFIDEEINNVGWVQLQNQYDNWKQSRWWIEDDPDNSVTCRECHMRLVDSIDPAAGDAVDPNRAPDDGRHRSHRFIGANQYHPALLDLPGAAEQVRLTEEWLRGETTIPEIEHKWSQGPAVPLMIDAPATALRGEAVNLRVIALNNKAGHDFPTGPLDIIQAWIEV